MRLRNPLLGVLSPGYSPADLGIVAAGEVTPARVVQSEVVFVLLGQFLDVVRRPIDDIHAEVETHPRQHFLDLVKRLAAEVRRAQHLSFGFLDQIPDVPVMLFAAALP